MSTNKLTKSRTNRRVSGVIGGIGEYFGWSDDIITIIRIVYTILALTSFGSLFLIYFIASIILPSASRNTRENKQDFSKYSQWPGDIKNDTQKRKDVTSFDDDEWSQF